jgi:outer membrane translocation and assembly module TamA
VLVSSNLEVALKKLGSQVGYVKNFFQISSFRALPVERRTVLAGRVEFGVAHGFQSVPAIVQRMGVPVLGPNGLPLVQPVSDLPASQRFFAGGGGTVRGFQIDLLESRKS